MKKKNLILIFLSIVSFSCSSLYQTSFNKMEEDKINVIINQLNNLSKTFGGRLGVYAKNLNNGEIIEMNSDSLFPTASVIKLPVLVTLFQKTKAKKINLDSLITIRNEDKVGGAGVVQYFKDDVLIKIIDAATLMIILSDNTATNAIIDLLGNQHDEKLNEVNSQMESIGLMNTKLLNKVFSYKTKKNTPEARRFGLGYSSPKEMGILLEKIYNKEIIDSNYSNLIIDIMKNQQDETMIRKYLPYDQLKNGESIIVANKTGAVDQSRIDVGIVFSPNGNFILSIFADESQDKRWTYDNKAQEAVAKAARILYDYFTSRVVHE